MRRAASIGSVILGILLVVGGVATWWVVADTLGDQKITTSEDACLADRHVADPFTAYCQAKVIDKHALDATGGLRYAELGRDDPLRATAAQASFLQASLFTSILAFGVAAMAAGMGVLFIRIGLGIRDVEQRTS
jgi:hypothetical protein